MKTSTKVWIGVGAYVVVGAGAVAVPTVLHAKGATLDRLPASIPGGAASASARVVAQHMRHGGEGGEGEGGERARSGRAGEGGEGEGGEGEGGEGEGGEGGAASLPADLRFALLIAQLRGHLVVGDQLVKQGEWSAAMPHFLHPTEEIYDDLRPQLEGYGVPPFSDALERLARIVKRKDEAGYARAFQAVQNALAQADAKMKDKEKPSEAFTLEATIALLKSAAGEYDEAVVDGRIAKPVEYQDARGFIWQAETMFDGVAAQLAGKDAEAVKEVRAQIGALKKAFPSAMPPKQPAASLADVLATLSKIELAANHLK